MYASWHTFICQAAIYQKLGGLLYMPGGQSSVATFGKRRLGEVRTRVRLRQLEDLGAALGQHGTEHETLHGFAVLHRSQRTMRGTA